MNPTEYADPECNRCEGKGWVVVTGTRIGYGWEDDGHGNPVPVPVPEPTRSQELCGCIGPVMSEDEPQGGGDDE